MYLIDMLKSNFRMKLSVIYFTSAAAAKLLQSCLTLCDPIDGSPPGSPVPGILQARTLERGDIFFSNAWKWKVKVKLLSPVRLLATPWTNVKPILYPWNELNLVIMYYPWPSFLYLAWFSLLICVCLCYFLNWIWFKYNLIWVLGVQ